MHRYLTLTIITGVCPKVELSGVVTLVIADPVTSYQYNSLSSLSVSLSNANFSVVHLPTVSSPYLGKSCKEESRSRYPGLE